MDAAKGEVHVYAFLYYVCVWACKLEGGWIGVCVCHIIQMMYVHVYICVCVLCVCVRQSDSVCTCRHVHSLRELFIPGRLFHCLFFTFHSFVVFLWVFLWYFCVCFTCEERKWSIVFSLHN